MPLSLNQKLKLSQRPNYLTLFDDKVFVKAYNESAYVLNKIVGKTLKPIVFKMQHYPFKTAIVVSIPKTILKTYLPDLNKTDFGFELWGTYDLSAYSEWIVYIEFYSER